MMEGIEHSSRFITILSPRLDSISASGEYPLPTLNLTADIARCDTINLMGIDSTKSEYNYSVINPDLAIYIGGVRKSAGTYLTRVICDGFPIHSWWQSFSSVSFKAPLNFFALERIEEIREGDLHLYVSGKVTLAIHANTNIEYSPLGKIVGYTQGDFEITYRIAQSTWVNSVLSKIGHHKYHLIELDLSHCQIIEALKYIGRMESSLAMHEYDQVANSAREMADYIENFYIEFPQNTYHYLKWIRAFKKFKHFASLALHKEEKRAQLSGEFHIHHHDAEYIIISAKALVRYAQQLVLDYRRNT